MSNKRKYEYYIVSTICDYYLGDALCRELEAMGNCCYYNVRDSKKNDKTPDNFFNFASNPTIIIIANNDFLSWPRYAGVFDASAKSSDFKRFIMLNEIGFQIPDKWKGITVIDSTYGLNREIISILVGKEPVLEIESSGVADKQIKTHSSETESPVVSQSEDIMLHTKTIVSPFVGTQHSLDTPFAETPLKVNTTQLIYHRDPIKGMSDETELSKEVVSENIKDNQSISRRHQTDVVSIRRNVKIRLSKLRTVKTNMPSSSACEGESRIYPEAWMVPLYIIPFELCAEFPDASYLFSRIENPSLTIQRAFRYLTGDGVPNDEKRAYSLFKKAEGEEQSRAEAKYCLGVCYEAGFGVEVDNHQALNLYREAHKDGFAPATSHLGTMLYMEGNIEEAVPLLNKARADYDIEASYTLGVIAQDNGKYDDAVDYYSEAAELGHSKAQNALAALYYNGTGVKRDESVALQWLEQSKGSNFIGADYNAVVYHLNKINKVLPKIEDLDYLHAPILALIKSLKKFHEPLAVPGIQYNYTLLMRRNNFPDDVFNLWWKDVVAWDIPYVEDYYIHYETEKKRRTRHAVKVSALNAAGRIASILSGGTSKWEDLRGGYFDNDREK